MLPALQLLRACTNVKFACRALALVVNPQFALFRLLVFA
jgi:hypothetical protein